MQRFIAATVFFGFPALVHTYSLADAHILVATGRLVHSPFKRLLETASYARARVCVCACVRGEKGRGFNGLSGHEVDNALPISRCRCVLSSLDARSRSDW